jgi:hypothetical protein
MSVKIKSVYECPRCTAPLTITSNERPKTCPECKYDFGEGGDTYKLPLTLTEQLDRLMSKEAYYDVILDMPIEKANSIMNDALHIIQTVPGKNVGVSGIRILVETSIKIGQIATKYREFLEAGGTHVPTLFTEEIQDGKTGPGKGSTTAG